MLPVMRKVILNWATGTHLEFTRITAPLTDLYAARHGFDVIRNVTDATLPDGKNRRPLAAGAVRVSAAVMNRQPLVARAMSHVSGRNVDRTRVDRAVDWLAAKTTVFFAPEEPPAWEKLRQIEEALTNYDVVVWLDADAVIVDHDQDLCQAVPEGSWLAMVEHRFGGRAPDHFNSGVMLFRRCPEARHFIREAQALQGFRFHRWWDQAAILYLLGYTLRGTKRHRDTGAFRALTQLPLEWNSIPGATAEHPRIKHYAGIGNVQRLRLLRADVERFQANLPPAASDPLPA